MAKSERSREDKGKGKGVFVLSRTPPSFLEGLLCDKTETVAWETGASSPALENF